MKKKLVVLFVILILLILSSYLFFLKSPSSDSRKENNDKDENVITIKEIKKIIGNKYNFSMPKLNSDGNKIYYISNESDDGNYQVWSMNINSSNRKQITFNEKGVDTYDISIDDQHMVFSKRDKMYILNLNNNTIMNLPQGWEPSFSPNGDIIIYISYTDLAGDLMPSIDMVDKNGNNYSEIKGWFSFPISQPIFSDDGIKIFYKINCRAYNIKKNEVLHSIIEQLNYSSDSTETIISNADNISYFDVGLENKYIIAVENGDLVKINIENDQQEIILDFDENIDFFDINYNINKIVFSSNGNLWLGNFKEE